MTPQSAEIIRLTRKLDEVTAERDHWRREVEGERNEARLIHLSRRLGLTPREAALLDALHQSPRPKRKETLFAVVWGDKDVDFKIFDVFICKLRKKLGAACIETIRGVGYVLSDEGRQMVDSALGAEAAA